MFIHVCTHTHHSPVKSIQQMASSKLKEALKNDGFQYKMRQERVKQMLKGCLAFACLKGLVLLRKRDKSSKDS